MSHSLYEVIMYVVDNTSLVDIPFMLTELLARTLGQIRIYYLKYLKRVANSAVAALQWALHLNAENII